MAVVNKKKEIRLAKKESRILSEELMYQDQIINNTGTNDDHDSFIISQLQSLKKTTTKKKEKCNNDLSTVNHPKIITNTTLSTKKE
mmetsp:Transcript_5946/g.6841  ORF Transcript_5946/g.6841 Transcript_5946/m.6841 type:complete len:86 (-) Transcript_5946:297-554(-)